MGVYNRQLDLVWVEKASMWKWFWSDIWEINRSYPSKKVVQWGLSRWNHQYVQSRELISLTEWGRQVWTGQSVRKKNGIKWGGRWVRELTSNSLGQKCSRWMWPSRSTLHLLHHTLCLRRWNFEKAITEPPWPPASRCVQPHVSWWENTCYLLWFKQDMALAWTEK